MLVRDRFVGYRFESCNQAAYRILVGEAGAKCEDSERREQPERTEMQCNRREYRNREDLAQPPVFGERAQRVLTMTVRHNIRGFGHRGGEEKQLAIGSPSKKAIGF